MIVWQKSMELARHTYAQIAALPKSEFYGLAGQIRRAAISIPSNIAEGHGRLSDLQFRHFLGNARGSVCELRTQIELSADLGYLGAESAKDLMERSAEVTRLLNGLISALRPHRSGPKSPGSANSANPANSANSATKGHR